MTDATIETQFPEEEGLSFPRMGATSGSSSYVDPPVIVGLSLVWGCRCLERIGETRDGCIKFCGVNFSSFQFKRLITLGLTIS